MVTKEAREASFLKLNSILLSDAGSASDQLSVGCRRGRQRRAPRPPVPRDALYKLRVVAVAYLSLAAPASKGDTRDASWTVCLAGHMAALHMRSRVMRDEVPRCGIAVSGLRVVRRTSLERPGRRLITVMRVALGVPGFVWRI